MSRQKEVQILRPNLIKREISRILNIIFPKKGEEKHLNLLLQYGCKSLLLDQRHEKRSGLPVDESQVAGEGLVDDSWDLVGLALFSAAACNWRVVAAAHQQANYHSQTCIPPSPTLSAFCPHPLKHSPPHTYLGGCLQSFLIAYISANVGSGAKERGQINYHLS